MIKIRNPKILIYDDENIKYITGNYGMLEDKAPEVAMTYTLSGTPIPQILRNTEFSCTFADFEQLDNIKLDDTTMKRIAKFNKEVDIKKLDKIIKEKEDKIKELDDILQDKEGRIKKLKEFVDKIYDIDIEDDEDYDYYDD